MNKKTIIVTVVSAFAISFGQQLRVDSVMVDSVWNSDSAFHDSNGNVQTRQSRDVLLRFRPIGPDSVQAVFAVSIDSARTWNPDPNPLQVLDNSLTKYFVCNQTYRSTLRVLGGDRPNTAFKVTIFLKDAVAPVITLRGPNPDTVIMGKVFIEPGASITDNIDGIIPFDSVRVTELNGKPLPINTAIPGVYTLLYNVKDKAGNPAIRKARIVRVTEVIIEPPTPPIITLIGAASCTVSVGTAFIDPGAMATDNFEGNISNRISRIVTNSANTVVLFSEFYKTIGLYSITYSVSDQAGNPAVPKKRSVYVKDTAAGPPLNLLQKYGVPLSTPLPAVVNVRYTNITVDGQGGPNMSAVKNFLFFWEGNTLYEFAFNYTIAPYYKSFAQSLMQTFGTAQPQFTVSGTTVAGLDGSYYINASDTQCVWVRTDGSFAVVFKN